MQRKTQGGPLRLRFPRQPAAAACSPASGAAAWCRGRPWQLQERGNLYSRPLMRLTILVRSFRRDGGVWFFSPIRTHSLQRGWHCSRLQSRRPRQTLNKVFSYAMTIRPTARKNIKTSLQVIFEHVWPEMPQVLAGNFPSIS